MNPEERSLGDLTSVGPATMRDFDLLGIRSVPQLARQEAGELYARLCELTGKPQDVCVLDTFQAAIEQARDPFLPPEQRRWYYWSRLRRRGWLDA